MIPIRTCTICKQKKAKHELIKLVLNLKNNIYYVTLDNEYKKEGRGIYICRNMDCIDKWIKNIEKNKFKNKYKIDKESLIKTLEVIKNEMGEKSWEK